MEDRREIWHVVEPQEEKADGRNVIPAPTQCGPDSNVVEVVQVTAVEITKLAAGQLKVTANAAPQV